jgi:DNA-directed RNA polymerase subunit RPC12/RpoP
MSKTYIEKEAALNSICYDCCERDFCIDPCVDYAHINGLPFADVKPVVSGEWKWNNDNGYYYCSKCGAVSPREDQDGEYIDCPRFCHNCGADMRKEAKDDT